MRFFKDSRRRHCTLPACLLLLFPVMDPIASAQTPPSGDIDLLCEQLDEAYDARTADRDYMMIIKIYQILERSYEEASDHEREMIIRTVQNGFRFDSPPGASRNFHDQGADSLMGMGKDGLKALLFSMDHYKVKLAGVDKLVRILAEAYEKSAPFDEDRIALAYDIFRAAYDEIDPSERTKILKAMERAFHVKTGDKEGVFKIAAASHLAGMDTEGLKALLNGVRHHKAAKLSFPDVKWDGVIKPLRDALYSEYDRRDQCDAGKVILIFDIFTELYGNFSKSQQKSLTAYIVKASRALPLPEKEDCLVKGANALSTMGKFGLDALEYLLKSKNLEGAWKVVQSVIVAMGRTQDLSALDSLVQLLWDDYPAKINAACTALSHYSALPLKVRKSIVKDIVKVYATLYTLAQAKNPSNIDAERYFAVKSSMDMVLCKLTNQRFSSAPQWQKWFNDNKGKPKW